ncbi:MAG: amidohydrolase family protein [Pyrinomonadaceae bacterium]
MNLLYANHVLPITSAPIERGAIALDLDRIVAVGKQSALAELFPDAVVEDFGNAAITPGLVNCHSHLEVTSMRGKLDDVEDDFSAWLLRLNEIRSSLSEAEIRAAAVAGAIEGARAGVTCFGDIGRHGVAGFEALKDTGLRGILYHETEFSPEDKTADEDFEKLIRKFENLRRTETALVKVGLSPHSPYTVGPRLLSLIAEYSISNGVPVSIHAGESQAEEELLNHGTGFFRGVYEKYDVAWASPMCSPIEYLERTGLLAARPLLAHCVCLSSDDIKKVAAGGASIAHCPKSNAKFGHGYAPFEAFLDSGIAVGLGSDSVASNNLCDIVEEARFAVLSARNRAGSRRFISAGEALETATLGGARAMGLDHLIGSLEAGKQADLAVFSLDHPAIEPLGDIESALIFSASGRDCIRTIVAGREINTQS